MGGNKASWTDLPEVPPEALAPQVVFASYWIWATPMRTGIYAFPRIQLMLITKGVMRYRAWDLKGRLNEGVAREGTIFSFFPGRLQYETHGQGPLHLYQVHFEPAPGALAGGIPAVPGIGRLPQLIAAGDLMKPMTDVFQRLMAVLMILSPTWRMQASSALLDLLSLAFQAAAGNRAASAPQAIGPWQELLARIEQRPSTSSVRTLAREMGMSVNHFIRIFRQFIGNTPKQYILARHMWQAHAQLQQDVPVKEVAYRCGFNDAAYFSRAYRKVFGVPPSQADQLPGAVPPPSTGLPICRHLWAPGRGPELVPMVGEVP